MKMFFPGSSVAQLIKHLASAQVMVSWFMSSSHFQGVGAPLQVSPTALSPAPSLSMGGKKRERKKRKKKEKEKVFPFCKKGLT